MHTIMDLLPLSLNDCLALVVAAVVPGMPKSVLALFAVLVLLLGWKFALCCAFGYYLLQFAIGGSTASD